MIKAIKIKIRGYSKKNTDVKKLKNWLIGKQAQIGKKV